METKSLLCKFQKIFSDISKNTNLLKIITKENFIFNFLNLKKKTKILSKHKLHLNLVFDSSADTLIDTLNCLLSLIIIVPKVTLVDSVS